MAIIVTFLYVCKIWWSNARLHDYQTRAFILLAKRSSNDSLVTDYNEENLSEDFFTAIFICQQSSY